MSHVNRPERQSPLVVPVMFVLAMWRLSHVPASGSSAGVGRGVHRRVVLSPCLCRQSSGLRAESLLTESTALPGCNTAPALAPSAPLPCRCSEGRPVEEFLRCPQARLTASVPTDSHLNAARPDKASFTTGTGGAASTICSPVDAAAPSQEGGVWLSASRTRLLCCDPLAPA
jgi:hypothetical protein